MPPDARKRLATAGRGRSNLAQKDKLGEVVKILPKPARKVAPAQAMSNPVTTKPAVTKPVLAAAPLPATPPPMTPLLDVVPGREVAPQTSTRLIRVEPGLHVLSVGPTLGLPDVLEGIALPAVQISSPPSDRFDPVEIMTAWMDTGAWLDKSGGIVVLRAPPGGGNLLITAYTAPGAQPTFPADIEVRPLDRTPPPNRRAEADRILVPRKTAAPHEPNAAATPNVGPPTDPREADIQVTLHIERQGDRIYPARGWVGNLGRRVRIEAFSLSPRSKLSPADIEYKAFGPQGRETRWTTDGRLCGTRGRGLPLTGFAIQLLPHLRDRFDVIYQGAFFDSGVTEPCRNGDPCRPARIDDMLEAISLRVVERDGS